MTATENVDLEELLLESDTERESHETLAESNFTENADDLSEISLPAKSKEKYMTTFLRFDKWRKGKNYKTINQAVLLEFFTQLGVTFKPSSLWAIYSMLKPTILAKHRINITLFRELNTFLKAKSRGFKSKQSRTLTPGQIEKFLTTAPDYHYLAIKVALIFGITGACKRNELCNLTIEDIEDDGTMLLVQIQKTEHNPARSFTVVGEFYNIVKSYMEKRPKNTKINRFFLRYNHGSCMHSVIGVNKFGSMPKKIAHFLNLPNAEDYTGHSFRRTSMALLADSGADVTTLKMHAGWKSNKIAEELIQDAILSKRKIGQQITETILQPQSDLPVKRVKYDYSRRSFATRAEAAATEAAKDPLNVGPSTSMTNHGAKASDPLDSTGHFLEVEIKDEFDVDFPESPDIDNDDSCASIASLSNEDDKDHQQSSLKEVNNIHNSTSLNSPAPDKTAKGTTDQQNKVHNTLATSNIDINVVERIVDRVTARLGDYFREMEKNHERRHQEYTAIRLNELELQKKMLDIREREFEMRKKQIVFCKSVNVARKDAS